MHFILFIMNTFSSNHLKLNVDFSLHLYIENILCTAISQLFSTWYVGSIVICADVVM